MVIFHSYVNVYQRVIIFIYLSKTFSIFEWPFSSLIYPLKDGIFPYSYATSPEGGGMANPHSQAALDVRVQQLDFSGQSQAVLGVLSRQKGEVSPGKCWDNGRELVGT